MATKRLRVGVIGAGGIAFGSHLPCLTAYGDVDLVLCERDESRLAMVADRFGIRERRTDHVAMLARDHLDAVIVLTPPHITHGVARDCLDAGVPTLLEKPPGLTTQETRDLLATSRRTGAPAMVAVNRRFNPMLTEARRLVEERGPIRVIVAEFYQFSLALYRQMGRSEDALASILVPGSIHTVDLLRFLGGDVAAVHAHADAVADIHPNSFTALIRFTSGATGLLNYDLTSPVRIEKVSFHAGQASAFLEGLAERCVVHRDDVTYDLGNVERRDPSSPEWSDRPLVPYRNGWWHQDRFFLDAVRDGRPIGFPAADLEDAVKTMELIDLIGAGWDGPVPVA